MDKKKHSANSLWYFVAGAMAADPEYRDRWKDRFNFEKAPVDLQRVLRVLVSKPDEHTREEMGQAAISIGVKLNEKSLIDSAAKSLQEVDKRNRQIAAAEHLLMLAKGDSERFSEVFVQMASDMQLKE